MKSAQDHINTLMLKEMAQKLVYFHGILDASSDIILVIDLKKKVLMFSRSGEQILGYKKAHLIHRAFSTLFKRDEHTRELLKLIDSNGDVDEFQIQAKTLKGALIPFSIGVRQLFDDESELIGYVVNMHDIHRRIALEKRLRRQYAELESIVGNSGAMIVTTDPQGKITKMNPRAEKILGIKSEEMIGRTMMDYYVNKSLRREMVRKLKKEESVEYEAEIRTSTGDVRVFFVVLSNIRSPLTNKLLGTVGISHDITSKKEAEDQLHHMLITDFLTDLGNRRHFFDCLKKKIKKAELSTKNAFHLAFLDMDHFKGYNDAFGHQKGDELLSRFGQLCLEHTTAKTPPAFFRYGGDEFVTIIPQGNIEKHKKFLERLRKKFSNLTGGHVTLSIGLTSYKRKDTVTKIISRADAAVYTSKKTGRNKLSLNI